MITRKIFSKIVLFRVKKIFFYKGSPSSALMLNLLTSSSPKDFFNAYRKKTDSNNYRRYDLKNANSKEIICAL